MEKSDRTELELGVSPSGHLHLVQDASEVNSADVDLRGATKLRRAFTQSDEEGLFLLSAENASTVLSASCLFWRDFSSFYLRELCQASESTQDGLPPIETPQDVLAALADRAPPMQGGEYLGAQMLAGIWCRLDEYVRKRVSDFASGLTGFLDRHAPRWRGVGRVFFHLAENKRNSDAPFAFLATYVGDVSSSGRVQHQPLAKALTQYADAKNKKTLQRILAPVHAAAKKSQLIEELVKSNKIFRPMTWTPQQAHQFLREAPHLEEAGVLVRLPDWWKKRPRPQVKVSIGEKRRGRLGADAMLDFNATTMLGEHELTEQELQELLKSESGLVSLRGQWVEVDQQKLQETLEHWKQVQHAAADGVDFLEGMRLLSGMPSEGSVADATEREPNSDWVRIEPGEALRKLMNQLRDPGQLPSVRLGRSLHTTLRPYQEEGSALA